MRFCSTSPPYVWGVGPSFPLVDSYDTARNSVAAGDLGDKSLGEGMLFGVDFLPFRSLDENSLNLGARVSEPYPNSWSSVAGR